jgi:hypothetical protein
MIQRLYNRRFTILAASFLAGFALPGCNKSTKQTAAPAKPDHLVTAPTSGAASPAMPQAVAKPSAPAASVPVAAAVPGQEVASAKALMAKLEHIKSVNDLPPLLTNESAATMGTMLGTMLYMVAGMAESFNGMASGMAAGTTGQPGSKSKLDPEKEKALRTLKGLKVDTEAVCRRYGVDMQAGPGTAPSAQLKANGRAFLADVLALVDKMPKQSTGNGPGVAMSPKSLPAGQLAAIVSKMRYRVVGRGRVIITATDKHGKKQEIEARIEDGGWRLHLADLGQLMGGGAPPRGSRPGGGPGPGAGGSAPAFGR